MFGRPLTGARCVPVQMSLWAFLTHPVHILRAAKGGVVRMNVVLEVTLIVPLKQQLMVGGFECRMLCSPSKTSLTATRTSVVVSGTFCNLSLPLMVASGALPTGPQLTARKRLLRFLGILVLIPVLDLSWCIGSKRVVLAYFSPFTVRAFGAYCALGNSCLPDMCTSCWTLGA